MEYTQWAHVAYECMALCVLILVVMEYTQWDLKLAIIKLKTFGLNPCCNGIYSMSSCSMVG